MLEGRACPWLGARLCFAKSNNKLCNGLWLVLVNFRVFREGFKVLISFWFTSPGGYGPAGFRFPCFAKVFKDHLFPKPPDQP